MYQYTMKGVLTIAISPDIYYGIWNTPFLLPLTFIRKEKISSIHHNIHL